MIAGLSSSMAVAVRTADEARQRVDVAARQIATGQRVSSAKDDGAAFTRAAAMKSQKVEWDSRRDTLGRLETGLAYTAGVIEQHRDIQIKMRELAVSMRATAAGSTSRTQLAAEWNALLASGKELNVDNNPALAHDLGHGNDAQGVGVLIAPADSFFSGNRFAIYSYMSGWSGHYSFADVPSGVPVALDSINVATASDSQLASLLQSLNTMIGDTLFGTQWNQAWLQQNGADQRLVESMRTRIDQNSDRLDRAIGSLSDADLGKASTALRQNETRQQLALQTVRQALDAYGAYAGGLLANAQRTQRALA